MQDPSEHMRVAAEFLRERVSQQAQHELGYDEAGIWWLDDYIERARLKPSNDEWRGPIHVIGAFLGECMVRCIGGKWDLQDDRHCVVLDEENVGVPHHKVAKQFQSGRSAGESILGFYRTMLALHDATANPLTPAQKRLQDYVGRQDVRVFVRDAMDEASLRWTQVVAVEGRNVKLQAPVGQRYVVSVALSSVQSFYVCTADERLVHTEWINRSDWETLPSRILQQIRTSQDGDPTLTLTQLARGKQLVEVTFGASDRTPDTSGRACYATKVRNVSPNKVRITRFGGFRAGERFWKLASVTGDCYTADDFREWYGQTDDWLLPGEAVCDTSNWGEPPVLWAYYGVTDAGETFVTGSVLEKPPARAGSKSGVHFVDPHAPRAEMADILDTLRQRFGSHQQRMNSFMMPSLLGSRPAWLAPADGLAEFFDRQELLLTEGHVVWGALVQANRLLFAPGDDDCPALLVHSPDPYFDARPSELHSIGRTFVSFKHTTPDDPELNEVAHLVTNEMDRSMGFELPRVFSDKTVHSAAFMVLRKHVPHGVLSNGIFPILTHPATRAVMVVPFEFWPIELIMLWKERQL